MTDWYHDLDTDDQQLVSQRWGSREFADWTATFMLTAGAAALRTGMTKQEREQFSYLLTQRRIRQMQPGHKPDLIERLHDALHAHVAGVVDRIDSETGRHGTAAVQWLDRELQRMQSDMRNLVSRLTG